MESEEAKIHVRGLVREVDEAALIQHFCKYGNVLGALVIRDRITKISLGYGYVSFSDPSSAQNAFEDHEHHILGKSVQVKKTTPRANQPRTQPVSRVAATGYSGDHFRTKKIFVGGLPSSLTEDEFKNFFEKFGETTDVVIMQDSETRKPRGFGFVTFESEESVNDVLRRSYYNLHGRYVEVKRAVPKDAKGCINCAGRHTNSRGYESGHGSGGFFPYYHYAAYGTFPSYGFLPGYGKSGSIPYAMGNYWAPYLVTPGISYYGTAPFYVNGFGQVPVMGVRNQGNNVNINGIDAQIAEMRIEDDSPDNDDLSSREGGSGPPSC